MLELKKDPKHNYLSVKRWVPRSTFISPGFNRRPESSFRRHGSHGSGQPSGHLYGQDRNRRHHGHGTNRLNFNREWDMQHGYGNPDGYGPYPFFRFYPPPPPWALATMNVHLKSLLNLQKFSGKCRIGI